MAANLQYHVVTNLDYSKPYAPGQCRQTPTPPSKTSLDLYLPASPDETVFEGVKKLRCKSSNSTEVVGSIPQQCNSGVPHKADGGWRPETMTTGGCNNHSKRPPPLVVFVYGGGWRRGDKQAWRHYISRWDINFMMAAKVGYRRLYGNIGESFSSRGVACATVSYPLVPTPFPINLLEISTSYLMTIMFTIFATFAAFLLLNVLDFVLTISFNHKLSVSCNLNWLNWDHYVLTPLSVIIIASQTITLILITIRETHIHKPNKWYGFFIVTLKLTTVLIGLWIFWLRVIAQNDNLFLSAFVMSVFTQTIVYYYQKQTTAGSDVSSELSRVFSDPRGQARWLARAVRWLVDCGRSTGHFDPNFIVLCGHSAGGHLVSLLALDDQYLTEVGLPQDVIKGVITLSAIHDVRTMNTGLIYFIYLRPAFGTDPADWARLSPINYLNPRCKHRHKPHFLLISAENDFEFMIKDSDKMNEELCRCGFSSHRTFARGCNHFTLVEKFGRSWFEINTWSVSDVERTCWEFVDKITHTERK